MMRNSPTEWDITAPDARKPLSAMGFSPASRPFAGSPRSSDEPAESVVCPASQEGSTSWNSPARLHGTAAPATHSVRHLDTQMNKESYGE